MHLGSGLFVGIGPFFKFQCASFDISFLFAGSRPLQNPKMNPEEATRIQVDLVVQKKARSYRTSNPSNRFAANS